MTVAVTRAAIGITLLVWAIVLFWPGVGAHLDALSGAPSELMHVTSSIVTEESAGTSPRVTTTQTVERFPGADPGFPGRLFGMPGVATLVKISLAIVGALLVGSFFQSLQSGHFSLQVAGLGVTASEVTQSLETVRTSMIGSKERRPPIISRDSANAPTQSIGQVYRPVPADLEALRSTIAEGRIATRRRYMYLANPASALTALRADLEQRLRIIAERNQIDHRSLHAIVRGLQQAGVLQDITASAVLQLIAHADQAANSRKLPAELLTELQQQAPEILERLDRLVLGSDLGPDSTGAPTS